MPAITYLSPYPGGWKNDPPDATTPINAAALQAVDDGVAAATAQANAALAAAGAAGAAGVGDVVAGAPTGTAADDALLTAAITAAGTNGRILLRAGIYGFTSHLVIPNGVDIVGCGGGGTSGSARTTLKAFGASAQLEIAGGGGLSGYFRVEGNVTATTPFKRSGGAGANARSFHNIIGMNNAVSGTNSNDLALFYGAQNDYWWQCGFGGADRDMAVFDQGYGGAHFVRCEWINAGGAHLRFDNLVGGGVYAVPTDITFDKGICEGGVSTILKINHGSLITFSDYVFFTPLAVPGGLIEVATGCNGIELHNPYFQNGTAGPTGVGAYAIHVAGNGNVTITGRAWYLGFDADHSIDGQLGLIRDTSHAEVTTSTATFVGTSGATSLQVQNYVRGVRTTVNPNANQLIETNYNSGRTAYLSRRFADGRLGIGPGTGFADDVVVGRRAVGAYGTAVGTQQVLVTGVGTTAQRPAAAGAIAGALYHNTDTGLEDCDGAAWSGYMRTGTVTTKTANYTAVRGDVVLCDTTGGTFTVSLPLTSAGQGRVTIIWVAGTVAPTIARQGSVDRFNVATTGPTTLTPAALGNGWTFESDAGVNSIWAAEPLGTGAGSSTVSPLTRTAVKTANYTAALWDLVPADVSAGGFTVTLPAASGGKGRIAVKVASGGNTLTLALTGTDHFNTFTGSTTVTLDLGTNQGVIAESDGAGIWTVTADDLPLTLLDKRYARTSLPTYAPSVKSNWESDQSVHNANSTTLHAARAAFNKWLDGVSDVHILTPGDSTFGGWDGTAYHVEHCTPRTIGKAIAQAAGLPFGGGIQMLCADSANRVADNVTLGSHWVANAQYVGSNASAGTALTVNILDCGTTVNVLYWDASPTGIPISIDGVAQTAIATTGTNTIKLKQYTGLSNIAHVVTSIPTAANQLLVAMWASNPAIKQVYADNISLGGSFANSGSNYLNWSDLTSGAAPYGLGWFMQQVVTAAGITPDIVIGSIGANDETGGAAAATIDTGVANMFGYWPSAAKALVHYYKAVAATADTLHDAVGGLMFTRAETLGAVLFDADDLSGRRAGALADSAIGSDSTHPKEWFQRMIGRWIAKKYVDLLAPFVRQVLVENPLTSGTYPARYSQAITPPGYAAYTGHDAPADSLPADTQTVTP